MCGITGIYYLGDKEISEATLTRFNNSQKHRGPDGEGIYINDEKSLGLAHRRLSVLDVSENAKQPMSFGDQRFHITYNGEIYNFLELKKELQKLGYSFKSNSDTEVILASYHKWGVKCLEKFNGMWAFAIWDSDKKKLFLARDRFGIKPLHILWVRNEILAFASETIAFKNLEDYSRVVNELHMASVLQNPFSLEGYGKTIFNDIEQLPAGNYCVFRKEDKELKFKRWWNTIDHMGKVSGDFEEETKHFKELFFDSCKLRLRSDVPIATALSGGLDSSAVYSTIKHIAKQRISKERLPDDWQTAFIATFPGADNDEREFAEQVINGVNGKGIFTVSDDFNIVENVISTTRLFDSIYHSPVSVAVDVYKAMRKNGYRVSLDGHGVDEMLFGYPHMLASAYSTLVNENMNFLSEDVKMAYEGLFTSDNHPDPITNYVSPVKTLPSNGLKSKIKKITPKQALEFYRVIKGSKKLTAAPAQRQSIPIGQWSSNNQIYINENEFYPGFNDLSPIDKIVFKEFHLTTLPTILRNFDRASMQNGIEIRMPFMDWRIVSYIFSLPFRSKVGNGYTKLILRNAMKDIVPELIRLRKTKMGFNAPMPMWFSNQLKTFIHDEVNSASFMNSDIWNAKEIKNFVEEKSKNGWSWADCSRFWPYLSAHLITKAD
jgi:asparagine synthase (glutamine-hydrolysing)